MSDQVIQQMLSNFQLGDELIAINEFKRGHIHDTFVSQWKQNGSAVKYVHQRINLRVFPNVEDLMSNIVRVTEHIRNKLAADEFTHDQMFSVIPASSGKPYCSIEVNGQDQCWRTFSFVENTVSINNCNNPQVAHQAAAACGRFLRYLSDLEPSYLHVTIDNFLDSRFRLRQLEDAIHADACSRVEGSKREIASCLDRQELCGLVVDRLGQPDLPHWITHNDTKLNNVLFDESTKEAISVVDLDTCMPGSVLYDFGDLVRTTGVLSAEDEPNLDRIEFDLELYRAIAEGFVKEVGGLLTFYERKILHLAPKLLTLTLAMRFLADHLKGDRYFKVDFPGHNLQRVRAQLRVVECLEEAEDALREILSTCLP